jgi:hypothetical protein
MDLIFADDARQQNPSRKNTGPLVAVGGLHVPTEAVGLLERAIDELCTKVGFPEGEEFKWSPGRREAFFRSQLTGENRLRFYTDLIALSREHSASAFVVVEDTQYRLANRGSKSHEEDVATLFLERADWSLHRAGRDGLALVASPSGGSSAGEKFLGRCVELRRVGTGYTKLERLPLGVVTSQSKHMRLLQLADVITSCVTARVAGESNFSPQVFDMIRPMLRREGDRCGGIGLKLHPDFVFANLYYWLLEDTHFWKGNAGAPLPIKGRPFSRHNGEAATTLSREVGG